MTRGLSLILLLALAGCMAADSNLHGETLVVDVVGTFDPQGSRTILDGPRAVLSDATQLGLVDLDATGQVVPGLATSWRVSDDGRSIIFRLRPVKWQDGRNVLARDAVTTFRRIAAPESRHPLKATLDRIINAPAIGVGTRSQSSLGIGDPLPNIVEVRLSTPQPALLQLLADQSTSILRKGDFPPPLGAFTVINAVSRPLHLARNPGYFDASNVALAGVSLLPVEDPVAAISRFRRGETDIVIGDGVAGLGEARTVADQRALRLDPTYGVYGYLANTRRGPLADARVRRALSMVVDRATLVQRLFAIAAMQPVNGIMPSNLPSHGETAQPAWANWLYIERLTEARRLLAEAGYGTGRPLKIKVTIPYGREHRAILDAVARDWSGVDVIVEPVVRPAPHLAADIAAGAFTLALTERRSPADSARFFLAPFACKPGGNYCNRQVDALLTGSRSATDITDRSRAIRQAEQLIVDDAPMIPLFVPIRWALVSPNVTGWAPNILGAHPLSRLNKTLKTKGK